MASRSARVIETVRLLHSVRRNKHPNAITEEDVSRLSELIGGSASVTVDNFVNIARVFIKSCNRTSGNVSRGCRMIVGNTEEDLYDSVLEFILAKPIDFFADYPLYENVTPSMSTHALRKSNAAFQCLNSSQRVAFQIIHKQISDSFKVEPCASSPQQQQCSDECDQFRMLAPASSQAVHSIATPFFGVLNSRSGTGKSTLMGALACSLLTPILFVVYSNALKENAASLHANITARTTCTFIMHTLNLTYNKAKCVFNSPQSQTMCEIFRDLYKLLTNFKLIQCNEDDFAVPYLLVFDEYTVMQPLMIVFLHMLSQHYNLNILMVGDANQQKAIRASVYHRMNNMHLLSELATFNIRLTKQMRITDQEYLSIIQIIESHLDEKNDNIRMDFHEKFLLYSLLAVNFHTPECTTAMYLTSTHKRMKDRIYRCYLRSVEEGRAIVKAQYCNKKGPAGFEAVALPADYKYAPLLLLIQGYPYVKYSETSKCEDVVHFRRKVSDTVIEVLNATTNKIEHLQRIAINQYNTIDELRAWLTPRGARFQYPLRFFANTYYSAQGLTLDKCDIELDLDDTTMNAVYVGLTRLRERHRLKRLHTGELYSLAYTAVKNDEYYYKVPEMANVNLCQKYKIYPKTDNDRMMAVHAILAHTYKNVTFASVTPEVFRTAKGRCVRVEREKFKAFIDSANHTTSPLLECYKNIKNVRNLFEIASWSKRKMHDTIKCSCEFKEDPEDAAPNPSGTEATSAAVAGKCAETEDFNLVDEDAMQVSATDERGANAETLCRKLETPTESVRATSDAGAGTGRGGGDACGKAPSASGSRRGKAFRFKSLNVPKL